MGLGAFDQLTGALASVGDPLQVSIRPMTRSNPTGEVVTGNDLLDPLPLRGSAAAQRVDQRQGDFPLEQIVTACLANSAWSAT